MEITMSRPVSARQMHDADIYRHQEAKAEWSIRTHCVDVQSMPLL
jgi:hypothetical protein